MDVIVAAILMLAVVSKRIRVPNSRSNKAHFGKGLALAEKNRIQSFEILAPAEESLIQSFEAGDRVALTGPSVVEKNLVQPFETGDLVELTGLSTKPELNGLVGNVLKFNTERERFEVAVKTLEGSVKNLLLRRGNLQGRTLSTMNEQFRDRFSDILVDYLIAAWTDLRQHQRLAYKKGEQVCLIGLEQHFLDKNVENGMIVEVEEDTKLNTDAYYFGVLNGSTKVRVVDTFPHQSAGRASIVLTLPAICLVPPAYYKIDNTLHSVVRRSVVNVVPQEYVVLVEQEGAAESDFLQPNALMPDRLVDDTDEDDRNNGNSTAVVSTKRHASVRSAVKASVHAHGMATSCHLTVLAFLHFVRDYRQPWRGRPVEEAEGGIAAFRAALGKWSWVPPKDTPWHRPRPSGSEREMNKQVISEGLVTETARVDILKKLTTSTTPELQAHLEDGQPQRTSAFFVLTAELARVAGSPSLDHEFVLLPSGRDDGKVLLLQSMFQQFSISSDQRGTVELTSDEVRQLLGDHFPVSAKNLTSVSESAKQYVCLSVSLSAKLSWPDFVGRRALVRFTELQEWQLDV